VPQMISIRDVLRRAPISRSTLERKVKDLQWQADLIENEIRPAEPVRVLVRWRS
jgi:hypothetical protein